MIVKKLIIAARIPLGLFIVDVVANHRDIGEYEVNSAAIY